MISGNPTGDGEPQPSPDPDRLGREKGLEQPGQVLGHDPGSIVRHHGFHVPADVPADDAKLQRTRRQMCSRRRTPSTVGSLA